MADHKDHDVEVKGGPHTVNEPYHDGSDPVFVDDDGSSIDKQTYEYTEDRKIGITGASFLILNKMIGTGIFSTPGSIFAATGSVGVAIILWIVGGILTFCGLSIFLEFGLAIPRSGGEKVCPYSSRLERVCANNSELPRARV